MESKIPSHKSLNSLLALPETAIRITNDIELWEIPNFATPEECDQIIEEAHRKGFQVSEVDDPKNAVTQSRTSTTAFLTSDEAPITQKVGLRAKEIVGPYELEGLQVQKYEKNQKYNPHYDTFDGKDGKDQRNYTAMLYLNDVNEGGTTLFTNLNLRLVPRRGSLILWNNLRKDNCRDEKTMHMGEQVEGDVVKYITTYWFHKKDSEMCLQKNSFGVRTMQSIDATFGGTTAGRRDAKRRTSEKVTPAEKSIIEYFTNATTGTKCMIAIMIILLIIGLVALLSFFSKKKNIKI